MLLGINVDHVATLRQARGGGQPNVLSAAMEALEGGADSITVHLREDRRHIQDEDVLTLIQHVPKVNLEMAISEEIVDFACQTKPTFCCLVPEKRQELTTEGGLDVIRSLNNLQKVIPRLVECGIIVSLFIDPDVAQIEAAHRAGASAIELHTGRYANHPNPQKELEALRKAALAANHLGLQVNAGHGLNYINTMPILTLPHLVELNIGHSIVSRAIFVGLKQAVCEMKSLL